MIRQIDTAIGLMVGGVVGWFHHSWGIWLALFGVLIIWESIDAHSSNYAKEKSETNGGLG